MAHVLLQNPGTVISKLNFNFVFSDAWLKALHLKMSFLDSEALEFIPSIVMPYLVQVLAAKEVGMWQVKVCALSLYS